MVRRAPTIPHKTIETNLKNPSPLVNVESGAHLDPNIDYTGKHFRPLKDKRTISSACWSPIYFVYDCRCHPWDPGPIEVQFSMSSIIDHWHIASSGEGSLPILTNKQAYLLDCAFIHIYYFTHIQNAFSYKKKILITLVIPLVKAAVAKVPGPSTVIPSSEGPQLAL